jgi:hypothetical protein
MSAIRRNRPVKMGNMASPWRYDAGVIGHRAS